jgi:hypothetical protein
MTILTHHVATAFQRGGQEHLVPRTHESILPMVESASTGWKIYGGVARVWTYYSKVKL